MAGSIQKLYENFYVGTLDPTKSTFTLPLNSIYLDTISGKFYRALVKGQFKTIIDVDDRSGGCSGNLTKEEIKFTGDGSKTLFGCDTDVNSSIVVIDGYAMSDTLDYDVQDDTKIKFSDAPTDGAEIIVTAFST